jgi:hypothetical protein
MTELLNLLLGFLHSFVRCDTQLLLENLALRHQLQVVLRSNPKPRLRNRDRILWLWIRRFFPGSWKRHLVVVRPETVISWHRRGWRLYWTWRSRSRFGRPRLSLEVRALIADGVRKSDPAGRSEFVGSFSSWASPSVRAQSAGSGIGRRIALRARPAERSWAIRRRVSGPPTSWSCRRSASGCCTSCSL